MTIVEVFLPATVGGTSTVITHSGELAAWRPVSFSRGGPGRDHGIRTGSPSGWVVRSADPPVSRVAHWVCPTGRRDRAGPSGRLGESARTVTAQGSPWCGGTTGR